MRGGTFNLCNAFNVSTTAKGGSALGGERLFQGRCRFACAASRVETRIILRLVKIDVRIPDKSVHRHAICAAGGRKMPMR